MSILNELIGAVRDISTLTGDAAEEIRFKPRYSSVSRRSMEGIMQFPVVVSRSVDLETLQMITKALEKQFASFLQTAITMSPFLNIKREKNAIGYLRKFHQNSNTRINILDDSINALAAFESYVDENMCNVFSSEDRQDMMIINVCEGSSRTILLSNKKGLVSAMEGIREDILNDKFIPEGTKYRFKNPHNQALYSVGEANVKTDARYANMSTHVKGDIRNEYGDVHYHVKGGGNIPGHESNIDYKLPNNVLQDNDVKKANELVPTSMHVRLIMVDGDGKPAGNMDFIAGVKATMHPVPTAEMVDNLTSVIRRGGKLFKTIRWTTGEISFLKDYILNLTDIKDDAIRETRGESQWWTALKHRRKLAAMKKAVFLSGDLLPNASIVISMEEAEHMKLHDNIDVLNPKVAYKLMKEYFLISFVVVDSAKGTVHFLFDGNADYQEVTFSGLERGDIAGRGVDFKDVLKLVQRV